MIRRHRVRMAVGVALVGTVVAAGCSGEQAGPPRTTLPVAEGAFVAAGLRSADGCEDLRDQWNAGVELAAARSGFGLQQRWSDGMERATTTVEALAGAAADMATEGANDGGGDAGGDPSTYSNNQEAGVDEGDIAKTDGRLLLSVMDGSLRILDVTTDTPRLVTTVGLGDPQRGWTAREIFLLGNRAVVVGGGWGDGPDAVFPGSDVTDIIEVDLTDPSRAAISERRAVEGSYNTGRAEGGTIRLVVTTVRYPVVGDGEAADLVATADALLPRVTSADGSGPEPLTGCSDVMVPATVSMASSPAPATTTVLTIGDSLGDLQPVAVQADFGTVYASTDSLYLASGRWDDRGESTEIHRFDLSAAGPARYAGSAGLGGRVINQYAMSQHEGHLRVATTRTNWDVMPIPMPMPIEPMPIEPDDATSSDAGAGSSGAGSTGAAAPNPLPTVVTAEPTPDEAVPTEPAPAPPETTVLEPEPRPIDPMPEPEPRPIDPMPEPGIPAPPETDNRLTVLRVDRDALVQVGEVTGLGKPGEQIQGVRFLGDRGYVVTFLQTDPLYAIDLSDPTAPTVVGELEIAGFSAYLHPVDERYLLGIGPDGDENGLNGGFKVALFEVDGPAGLREVAKVTYPDAYSPAQGDPLAFTWDAERKRAIIPVQTGMNDVVVDSTGDMTAPPAALKVIRADDGGGLTEAGSIDVTGRGTDAWDSRVRSYAIGERLVVVTPRAVSAHAAADLSTLGTATLSG